MSTDPRRDLSPWFRLFTRLQGEQLEAELLSTLALELSNITGAQQITLHRSRPGEGTQVQAVLGEPAKLTEAVPEELGQTITEDARVCAMVYNGWRETIWLVLVVDDPRVVADVLPDLAPQLGELLYNIRASEASRAEGLEHLQQVHDFKARVASLLQRRGQHMDVAPSREDALWEAVGSLHQLAQLPLTLIIEDDGTAARALASDPHGNRFAVQIRDLELLVMLRHILLSGRGRVLSGSRALQLGELLTEREALHWFYLQPLRAGEHFQGLIGVALSEARFLPAKPGPETAGGEQPPEIAEAVASWRSITRARLMAVVSAAASEIGQFIRAHAVREQAFEAGATSEAVHLGMDIHDSLLPELANVRLQLETLRENAPQSLTEQLDRIIGDLGTTAKEARQLAVTLTSADRWHDLFEMMDVVAARFRARTNVPLEVRITGPHREIGYRANAQLIRVFQEALNNVWKHAQATHVTAELTYLPLSVRLTVSDDGRGFDPAALDRERLGIRGMERRAKELGGDLRVESNREGGTTVTLDIPV